MCKWIGVVGVHLFVCLSVHALVLYYVFCLCRAESFPFLLCQFFVLIRVQLCVQIQYFLVYPLIHLDHSGYIRRWDNGTKINWNFIPQSWNCSISQLLNCLGEVYLEVVSLLFACAWESGWLYWEKDMFSNTSVGRDRATLHLMLSTRGVLNDVPALTHRLVCSQIKWGVILLPLLKISTIAML